MSLTAALLKGLQQHFALNDKGYIIKLSPQDLRFGTRNPLYTIPFEVWIKTYPPLGEWPAGIQFYSETKPAPLTCHDLICSHPII